MGLGMCRSGSLYAYLLRLDMYRFGKVIGYMGLGAC